MKRTFALLICSLVATSLLVGCEASGQVDTNDHDANHKTEYKKTTYRDDGDRTVKTETRTERSY